MQLPPEDLTPPESFIKTVDVSALKTRDLGSFGTVPTVDLGDNKTETCIIDTGKISLGTLVRARQGGAASATAVANRKYEALLKEMWHKGLAVGAGIAITISGVGVIGYALIFKWKVVWPVVKTPVSWVWNHLPWSK